MIKTITILIILFISSTAFALDVNYSLDGATTSPQSALIHDGSTASNISQNVASGTNTWIGQVDFNQSVDINEVKVYLGAVIFGKVSMSTVIEIYYSGSWHNIYTSSSSGFSYNRTVYGTWSGVTAVKVTLESVSTALSTLVIYEVWGIAFEDEGFATVI